MKEKKSLNQMSLWDFVVVIFKIVAALCILYLGGIFLVGFCVGLASLS